MARPHDLKPIREAAMDVPGVGACVVYYSTSYDGIVIKNYFGLNVMIDAELVLVARRAPCAVHDLVQREVRRALEMTQ